MLFLDEPIIGLNVVSKQAVRAFLATLGTTLVLTTHDLDGRVARHLRAGAGH